jgi:hypothetical protein
MCSTISLEKNHKLKGECKIEMRQIQYMEKLGRMKARI